jgi:hypothetical protein
MEPNPTYFQNLRDEAHAVYTAHAFIRCPYFKADITLNSDGFHYLQFSARRERDKKEQVVKSRLLPKALEVLRRSGTVQEYRRILAPVGKPSKRDGSVSMKEIEYWGFVALVGENPTRIRVIVRRIGNGNVTFWSVMFHSKMRNGKQRLCDHNIEDHA